MEKESEKKYEETIIVTQADNGILLEDAWDDYTFKVFKTAEIQEGIGTEIYKKLKQLIEEELLTNKIKITLIYEPL